MGLDTEHSSMAPLQAVLLDDNREDRLLFRSLLRRHPSIQLVGEAETLQDALKQIDVHRAQLLFLEAEIGGKSVFEHCHLVPPSTRMIFLTNHREGALRAFELDALDYLTKPAASGRLAETVRRMLRIEWERPTTALTSPTTNILIPFERGRRGISLEDIFLIQAFGNYTRLILSDGKSEIVLRSLSKWEQLLPMPPFLRVHRNSIVHAGRVKKLEEGEHGCELYVENHPEAVPISRRCLTEVRKALFATNTTK